MSSTELPGKMKQVMIVDFSADILPVAATGLSFQEDFGRWTDGYVVRVPVPGRVLAFDGVIRVDFNVSAYVPPALGVQKVDTFIDGIRTGVWSFRHKDAWSRERLFFKMAKHADPKSIVIEFVIHNPVCPRDTGGNDDERMLGLALKSMEIYQVESFGKDEVEIIDFDLLAKRNQ